MFYFFIFINDLPTTSTPRREYSLMTVPTTERLSLFKTIISSKRIFTLVAWERKSGMNFHPQKCNVLRVSRAESLMQLSYRLEGTVIAEEATTKYLDADMQHNLSWNQHVNWVIKKANNIAPACQQRNQDQG